MTTPTGRLAYGQAGSYDAVDDRAVIAAVSGYRTGLAGLPRVAAGAGLQIIISGGWLGIADCGDLTSAVVGSPSDEVVTAAPGPPTGTREDVIWVDVDPDAGVWTMVVIPASATAGRPGLALASVTVPANATLASQMTIRPADALLERRIIAIDTQNRDNIVTSTNYGAAANMCATPAAWIMPGRWYRVVFDANSPLKASGTGNLEGRIAIGMRPAGTDTGASVMQRAGVITFGGLNRATSARCELVFRHPPGSAPVSRIFDGRLYNYAAGTLRVQANPQEGALVLTLEDMGP